MTRKFLLVLLLCMPIIAKAAGETSVAQYKDIDNSVKSISGATSISDAATKYETEFNKLANYYGQTVKSGTISTERKNMQELKNNALNGDSAVSADDVSSQYGDAQSGTETDVDRLEEAKKKYEDAKATEQSLENRTLTALSTAATGIGGMELAMGLSQQKADKDAAQSMAAYIATMRCTYGDGKQVKAGPDEIELPGGNNQQLMNLRAEYFALANDLKERKTALNMKPGIESEEILDKAATGLYDDEMVGITSGAYESLYRAQMLGSEADQAKIDEKAKTSKNRVMGGAIAAGAGALVGVVGNSLINGKLGEKIKEGIANKKVGQETQKLLKAEADALKDIQKCLKSAGVTDAEKLSFSEFYPSVLSFKSVNVKCDTSLIAEGSKTVVAKELIYDSINEAVIYNHLTAAFGPENTGKMIGYTLPANPSTDQITGAQTKIKTSIESIQKKFKEAEEKDKKSAEKAGISIGNFSGSADGGGIASMSSLFSGMNFDSSTGGSSFLSSFMNK